jgi:hypothetical protein
MEGLNMRIGNICGCLQSLAQPEYCSLVEKAVEKKDSEALISICKKAKIPTKYFATIVATLLSTASPQQKYPEWL